MIMREASQPPGFYPTECLKLSLILQRLLLMFGLVRFYEKMYIAGFWGASCTTTSGEVRGHASGRRLSMGPGGQIAEW